MALTVLLGGARSGKSALATRLAAAEGGSVTVVATGEARDDEMAERIRAHRAARPEGWTTIEEPLELARAIEDVPPDDVVIVDCLSLWVSNALEAGLGHERIAGEARAAADALAVRRAPAFGVSNEVGLGIVPMHPLGRAYRDLLGRVNATWAAAADRAFLVVADRVLALADVSEALELR
jgi:adenosylcobinamide kinase / adenosylcobinamide-phosphate guanylyltransferase